MSEEQKTESSIEDIEQKLESMPTGADRFMREDEPEKQEDPTEPEKPADDGDQAPEDEPEEHADNDTVDEDDEEDGKGGNPYAKMRIALKKERQIREELQSRLEKLESSNAGEQVKPEQDKDPAEAVPSEQVFDAYARSLNGEYDNSDEVERAAKTLINGMSAVEIFRVVQSARSGGFGAMSSDIEQLALSELNLANARDTESRLQSEQLQKQQAETFRITQGSMQKMAEQYPELADENSGLRQYMETWRDKYLGRMGKDGAIEATGPLASLLQNPSWPETVIPLLVNEYRVNELGAASQMMRTKQKIDENKRTPGRPGTSLANRGSRSDSEAIEEKLAALGNVGKY